MKFYKSKGTKKVHFICITAANTFFFIILNQLKYITFLVYNTKISDNNAESGKVPRMFYY
jgi:hypothetical protein